jgi:hypothetical protein
MNLLSRFKSSENPRYKIVEYKKINHFGEITDRIYLILERKWRLIYVYFEIRDNYSYRMRFDTLKLAEEYLAKKLTPEPNVVETVVKEIL